jgi:hypothetical protein
MPDFTRLSEIPKDIRERLKVKGHVDRTMVYCETYTILESGALKLNFVLMDTSDKSEGIVLAPRFSLLDYMIFSSQYKWSLRPVGLEEKL